MRYVHSLSALRPALASLAAGGLLFGLLGLLLRRDWNRAALICALTIVAGNLFGFLVWWSLLPVLFLAGMLAIRTRPTPRFTRLVNLVSGTLLVSVLISIGMLAGPRDWFHSTAPAATGSGGEADVYFIVLDSYTGHATLVERFGYDNTSFLQRLAELGFDTGDCQSDYPNTDESIASTLNPGSSDLPQATQLWAMIRDSEVRSGLEQRGYRTVAFETGFVWTEIIDAEVYLQPPMSGGLTIFEILYLKQTPLRLLQRFYDLDSRLSQIYRERTEVVLAHLPDAASMQGPQFVFAHLLQPHPPFVFDPNGDPADWRLYTLPGSDHNPATRAGYSQEGYAAGYVAQVRFIEKAILPVLEQIVSTAPDSIIVLAGDHGPWFSTTQAEEHSILCAVRGPGLPLQPREAFAEILR